MNAAARVSSYYDMEFDVESCEGPPELPVIAKPPRAAHRYRISVRGLLILVTAICVMMGVYVAPAARQYRAVNAVLLLGGSIGYREDQRSHRFGWSQRTIASFAEHQLLDDLFKTVVEVDLRDTKADDGTCRQLLALPSLETIDLADTNVTDEGGTALAVLPHISKLLLDRTRVGDKTLIAFHSLRRLAWIELSETLVTDDGVLDLLSHTQLMVLALDGTRVTDSTVGALASQTRATMLSLKGVDATPELIDELSRELPNCVVSY